MIDMTRLHQLACTAANAAVPNYIDNGTPEHSAWLAAYDAEFAILLLMPGSVL
jgi:hypothetical protein